MNYNYFALLVIAFCFLLLIVFQAYGHLLIAILLIGFYSIVVQSGKFPKLRKFIDDAF
jgi:hypothetical protein